jgi:hypothetical protein
MTQADLAADHARPELAEELPVDPQARAETRARAARSVAGFAQTSALTALDSLLAAEQPGTARRAADDTAAKTALLSAEVARFRALSGHTD